MVSLNSFFKNIRMGRKKRYLGIFYGSSKELNDCFVKISSGELLRYVVTDETIICRFSSKLSINDIDKIFNEGVKNIPFFIFPIDSKRWSYNLPYEAENNLLTDNPIIEVKKQTDQNSDNFLTNLLSELSKRHKQNQEIQQIFNGWVNYDDTHNFTINPDGSILVNNYTIKITELIEELNKQLETSISEENYELSGKIKKKIIELNTIIDKNDNK